MAKRAACGTLLVVTVSFWMLAAGSLPAESSPDEGVAEAPAVQLMDRGQMSAPLIEKV